MPHGTADGTSKWTQPYDSAASSVLVWVVDNASHLPALLQLGVRQVISNAPLMLQAAIRALCHSAHKIETLQTRAEISGEHYASPGLNGPNQ